MPERAAETTKKAADRIAKRAEQYGLDISYVGTRFGSESGPKYLAPGTAFETREENGRTEFIFNEKLLADPDLISKMEDAARRGYHPKGVNSVAAYADHDIAHLLFYKAKMDECPEFLRYMDFLYRHRSMARNLISDYAVKSVQYDANNESTVEQKKKLFAQEILAVCWASEKNTWRHSRLHKKIATMLDNRLVR